MPTKNLKIRNSTAEFLMFTSDNKQDTIEVKVVDENVWLTQKLIAELFGKGRSTTTEHLKNIFKEELIENPVCRNFRHTGDDGKEFFIKEFLVDSSRLENGTYLNKFEKYRIIQDKLYKSDFDEMILNLEGLQ